MLREQQSMKEDAPKLLFDVLSAVETIEHFITGKSIDDYQSDKMLRSAVERQFLVIGEALVKLRSLDPETAATIPEPRQIIAFRNLLGTTRLTVWDIAQRKLPELKSHVARLLHES
jgi:uncharacterized protein with HEPN domain